MAGCASNSAPADASSSKAESAAPAADAKETAEKVAEAAPADDTDAEAAAEEVAEAAVEEAATEAVAEAAVADAAGRIAIPTGLEEGDPNHPIYSYDDAISLGGVKRPQLESRKQYIKALPTETTTEPLFIGATINASSTAWFVQEADYVKSQCEHYGWECNCLVAEFDAQKQSEQVDTFITQGVDAIVIDSTDFQTGSELVERANQAGIPCIGTGQQLDVTSGIITTIMSNSYESAFEAGMCAAEYLDGVDVKAATLLGGFGVNSSESRMNGMMGGFIYKRSQLSGEPLIREDAMLLGQYMMEDIRATGVASSDYDFEIVASNGSGQWSEIGGQAAAEDVMTGHPEINLLLVDQDFMGIGVVTALENMGFTLGKDGVTVICPADSYKPAMELVKEGKMLCTGYGPASMISIGAIDLLHMIFVDGYDASDMPISLDLPVITITKDNVDEYIDPNSDFAKVLPFTYMTTDEYNALNAPK
jgi:ribose transport system substrate-binding protein